MLHVQCLYSTDCGNKCGHVLQDVVNTAGFYTEERGGGAGIPPPLPHPEIFKLSMVIILTGIKQQSCPRLRHKQSERI